MSVFPQQIVSYLSYLFDSKNLDISSGPRGNTSLLYLVATMAYYLDSDKIWQVLETDSKITKQLVDELGLTPLTATFLTNRGIKDANEATSFLNPSSKSLTDAASIPDIKKAAQRIKQAIKNEELIYIHGDYDVDGVTSATLLYECLRRLKANVRYYIPCRFKEGYGLKKNTINKIIEEGAKLLVTVDCGIKSFSEAAYAQKKGLDVIITDHHEAGENLPNAFAVVDPKIHSENLDNHNLAGVGVALKLAQLLCDDPLEEYFDLVALGTVADLAPLLKENRYLAKRGIDVLNKGNRPGIIELAKIAGMSGSSITSETIAYALAPRINAGGRVSQADICVKLLSTQDQNEAVEIALKLDEANKKRKKLEEKMLDQVLGKVEKEVDLDKEKVIFVAEQGWHDGIKGIIASKIKERFFRPAFVGTIKDGKIQASGRSIPNFPMNEALEHCSELVVEFGGHKKAAGVSVRPEKFNELKQELNNLADEWLDEKDLHPIINIDAQSDLDSLGQRFQNELTKMAPYGEANRSPKILIEDIYLQNQQRLGKSGNHLRLDLCKDNNQLKAIAFSLDSFSTVLNHQGKADLIIEPDFNEYNARITFRGKVVDLRLKSLALDSPKAVVDHLFANANSLAAKEDYKNIGDVDSFFTKLAGVTFDGRQEIINKLKPNTPLVLKREPENKHDPNAIRVLTRANDDLGFLNKRLAKQLATLIDAGDNFDCRIIDVTGGEGKNFGVNIVVEKYLPANQLDEKSKSKIVFQNDQAALGSIKQTLLPGYSFNKYQEQALGYLLEGQNTLAIMGTGRGKSVIFQTVAALKALREQKLSIILYPLRSLIADQYAFLKDSLAQLGVNVVRISGDCSLNERQKIFQAINQGQIDIALTTPEFLHHNIASFEVVSEKIGFLVIDEAHHVSTSSQSHRPLYKRISNLQPVLGKPLIMAATATSNDETYQKIVDNLAIEQTVIDPTIRENLQIIDKRQISAKESHLSDLINSSNKVLVYVNSREQTAKIANNLRHLNKNLKDQIVYYHAGLSARLRHVVQQGFTDSTFKVVVATSAFGEGINIADIRDLALYHMPFSFIEYNQQSGRGGRDGKEGRIHLLFGTDDVSINDLILESKAPGRQTLTLIWQILSQLANDNNEISGNISEITNLLNQERPGLFNNQTVASTLKIFLELDLIGRGERREARGESDQVENKGQNSVIILKKGQKVDLNSSVRYEEGLHEKEQFAEFKEWALNSSEDELLKMINQPIYPKKHGKHKEAYQESTYIQP